ncbi:MAG: DUF364 domain-containing protein [Flavobacteriaceae bacterium]|nr:DUF364 domain-containing protein [Flavobacteriaceae bacterium]
MITDKTYELLKSHLGQKLDKLYISDVVIGMFLAAVQLNDHSYGVASTIDPEEVFCPKKNRDYGEFTPTKIKGKKVSDLFATIKNSNVISTLRIAVLNALSSKILESSDYKVYPNTDPYDLLDLSQPKTVTIVGAFQSYIKKFSGTHHRLHVLELDENALNADQKQYFVPAADYRKVLPGSDIVIITGLTIVNNTIGNLLDAISGETKVIVTGPSSSMIPDILFENKVNYIGAVKVTDGNKLFQVAGQGGHGYHLFNYCAEKICIVNE